MCENHTIAWRRGEDGAHSGKEASGGGKTEEKVGGREEGMGRESIWMEDATERRESVCGTHMTVGPICLFQMNTVP